MNARKYELNWLFCLWEQVLYAYQSLIEAFLGRSFGRKFGKTVSKHGIRINHDGSQ